MEIVPEVHDERIQNLHDLAKEKEKDHQTALISSLAAA
jgi:hypothetical protein